MTQSHKECPICGKFFRHLKRHLKSTHQLTLLNTNSTEGTQAGQELVLKVADCRLKFDCPRHWSEMEKTPFENVRFCGACKQEVFLAKNEEALQWAASRNKCAAVMTSEECFKAGMFEPPLGWA